MSEYDFTITAPKLILSIIRIIPTLIISQMLLASFNPTQKNVLVITHSKHAKLGRIEPMLRQKGYRLDIRCPRFQENLPATLDSHEAVIILGGVMSANDSNTLPFIRTELEWIPKALDSQKPFLGICLGAQLLARVLGATVALHPEKRAEIGFFPIKPTEIGQTYFSNPLHVYHWHCEGFEVPKDAVLLAQGNTFPNQAFRYGKNAYGLQFHPEATLEIIRHWITEIGQGWLNLNGAQSPQEQMQMYALYEHAMENWCKDFLDIWVPEPTGTRQLAAHQPCLIQAA